MVAAPNANSRPAVATVVAIQAGVAAMAAPIAMAVQCVGVSCKRFVKSIDLHHIQRYA
jgi:hypothetical protein